MSQSLDSLMEIALKRLEAVYNEVAKSQGYTEETEKLRLILELAREQIKNENTSDSTR